MRPSDSVFSSSQSCVIVSDDASSSVELVQSQSGKVEVKFSSLVCVLNSFFFLLSDLKVLFLMLLIMLEHYSYETLDNSYLIGY